MKSYCVYIHRNKLNGKVYVGQTSRNPKQRWNGGSGYPKSTQLKMYNAIQKYGWEGFDHLIIKTNLTAEEANKLEKDLIKKYNSFAEGYNMSLGGEGTKGHKVSQELKIQMKQTHRVPHLKARGKTFTEEHKKHLSEARKGRKFQKHSKETKQKISNALKGKLVTEETRKKMSQAKKGTKPWNTGLKGLKGHRISEKTKEKIAQANGYRVEAYIPKTSQLKLSFVSIEKALDYLKETFPQIKSSRFILINHVRKKQLYCNYIWTIKKENK